MSEMKVIHNSRSVLLSLLWGAFGFGVVVMILFLTEKPRERQPYEKNMHLLVPTVSSSSEREGGAPVRNPSTHILPPQEFTGATIRYTMHGFSPNIITLEQNEMGCVLRIANDTNNILIIRLSPHTLRDNWGFAYAPLAPGASLTIDPRYRIAKIAFHNHERPEEEFKVILRGGCILP